MHNFKNRKIVVALLLLLFPCSVLANAGVPMLFLAMPVFVISLLPIIAIETLYLSKSMALNIARAAKTVSISNLVSTVVGIPLTWVILVVLQMVTGGSSAYGTDTVLGKILAVTWQAPWLIPYEQELGWMVPTAGVVLLVPFFFASWWAEYFVLKKILKEQRPGQLKAKVRNANLITYVLLACWPISMLVFNYVLSY
ncbi:hypothetical protein L4D08_17660 [Photobacterium chitinilyticum]|uniref:hypothetical protein n=1 Tax=Photobacterium chitinilyticum TaxID=2485123 RepID=UPI003D145F75